MSKFIELTRHFDESKVLINANMIESIAPSTHKDGFISILFSGDDCFFEVQESYEEIKKKLEAIQLYKGE